MKKVFLSVSFFVIATVVILSCLSAQQVVSQAAAELTFSLTRQSGPASNQFAVWVEDAQGQYVKTIYATRYTANGGWKQRASSIPLWVKRSGLSAMTSEQVDALTGATPQTGTLTYTWDGTDSKGVAVSTGNYVIIL